MATFTELSGWPPGMSIFPEELGIVVRIISWIFVTLGVAFLIPIASLILFDFFLWIWRLIYLGRNANHHRRGSNAAPRPQPDDSGQAAAPPREQPPAKPVR